MCRSVLCGVAVSLLGWTLVVIGPAEAGESRLTYRPIPPPANFSPPAIQVDNASFDWGVALQGEKVRHDYKITNTGGSPLVISQVRAGCGCTTAGKPTKPIAPGQSDLVTLEIDTKRFTGNVSKGASIYSNALPSPYQITIGGNVEALYKQDPPNPRLEVVRGLPAEPIRISLARSPNSKVNFKIVEAATDSQVLQISVMEVKPGELYEISVGADVGQDSRKYFYEKLSLGLEVDGKGTMDHDINVSVTVKERIDVQPRTSVYFSRNDTKALKDGGSEPIAKTLEIVSLGGPKHSFEIKGITVAPPTRPRGSLVAAPAISDDGGAYFDTKVETVEPGKRYRLIVQMNKLPSSNVRTLRERLVIETDDPTVKDLTVTAMAAIY